MPRPAVDPRLADALRRLRGARCIEPHVWDVLTTGRYARAVRLSAPAGPEPVQPAVPDGRGWARLVRATESRAVLAAKALAWRRAARWSRSRPAGWWRRTGGGPRR